MALSGGLDSSWTLWRVLAQSGVEVCAHHVAVVGGNDARHAAERRAVTEVSSWLTQHVRPFTLGYSELDLGDVDRDARDLVLLGPSLASAAVAAGLGESDAIIIGNNADDAAVNGAEQRAGRPTPFEVVAAAFAGPAPRVTALEPAPTREEQVAELPAELVGLTWSCRLPTVERGRLTPCGLCGPCVRLARLIPKYNRFGSVHLALAMQAAMADPDSSLSRALGLGGR